MSKQYFFSLDWQIILPKMNENDYQIKENLPVDRP